MAPEESGESETPRLKCALGIRHVQVVMLFFGLLIAYSMRVNMSMAIVAMTDKNSPNNFNWNTETQSLILSSFFWGYIILQIPAGVMAAKYGGCILVTIAIASNAIISLLIPLVTAYGDWKALCASRVLQGLGQGVLYPTIHSLLGKWVPVEEKGQLGSFIYAGSQLGTAIQLLASGFIADYCGWQVIFYVNGVAGALWTAAYIFLGSDSPQGSKLIGDEEKRYIQKSLGQVGQQEILNTPWKAIGTSLPFLALLVTHCSQNWGFFTLMTEMPSYMKQILAVDIKQNGILSSLPFLLTYLVSFPFGFVSDYSLKKKWIGISTSRKICNTIGQWGPAITLIGLCYVPAGNVTLAVALLTISGCLSAGHYTGYLLVHIDMAPNFAGAMMGVTNFFANIISIIAPLIAGLILQDETNPDQWRLVFYVSSAVYAVCNLFFLMFGTSEKQPWNNPKDTITMVQTTASAKT